MGDSVIFIGKLLEEVGLAGLQAGNVVGIESLSVGGVMEMTWIRSIKNSVPLVKADIASVSQSIPGVAESIISAFSAFPAAASTTSRIH